MDSDPHRNQTRNRGDRNPAEDPEEENTVPEVVLPGEVDGDRHPFDMPPRGEDEPAEVYAMRLMQTVTIEQLRSFQQMVSTMKDISERTRRIRSEWDDSGDPDSDGSKYQDAPERVRIKRIRKRIQAPIFKGKVGKCPEHHLLRATEWFDS